MVIKKTGTIERRRGKLFARLRVDTPAGQKRIRIPLDTQDLAHARAIAETLAGQLERGEISINEAQASEPSESFEVYSTRWLEARRSRGVAFVGHENTWISKYFLPHIGALSLDAVRPSILRGLLESVHREHGLKKETMAHLHRLLHRIFETAFKAELIEENPMKRVERLQIRELKKEREILTDEEVIQFLSSPLVSLELKAMGALSRIVGGMRAGDLKAIDWAHVDLETFGSLVAPRAKSKRPMRLEIPQSIRLVLRAYHESLGAPTIGPVFPVTKGPRKGETREGRSYGWGKRLRKALLLAGIDRHELHNETAYTLPVDWHSFRRAFVTALARAGVNAQTALQLAGHSNLAIHARYLSTTQIQMIPAGAVPGLDRSGPAGTNDKKKVSNE